MISEKKQRLLDLMLCLPPDKEEIEAFLIAEKFSSDEVSNAMCEYIEECMYEDFDVLNLEETEVITEENMKKCHSFYLYELMELLLRYGLNPNYCTDDMGTMLEILGIIGIPYIAADVLNLLIDHGADIISEPNDAFISDVIFDVEFGAFEQESRKRFDALVHFWFVIIGSAPDTFIVDAVKDFDLKKLREHRNYDYALTYAPNDQGDKWSLRIFDKYSKWEVAVF